jgi:hypothetical protein
MRFWNLAAEILGFLSACLLLWPAITQNAQLKRAWRFKRKIAESPLRIAEHLRHNSPLVAARAQKWSQVDQWLLTGGALTLLLSFLIKVIVVWNTP